MCVCVCGCVGGCVLAYVHMYICVCRHLCVCVLFVCVCHTRAVCVPDMRCGVYLCVYVCVCVCVCVCVGCLRPSKRLKSLELADGAGYTCIKSGTSAMGALCK